MRALILAAGLGANLSPFTTTRPKPMIKIGGKFILENTVKLLKESGVNDINIVVGHRKEKITDHFDNGMAFGVNIHYIDQGKAAGIGDAILKAENRFNPGEYFLLIYGDILTSSNIYIHTIQAFGSARAPVASICLTPSSKMFGNVYLNNEMMITKIIEKPRKGTLGNYVLSGVFILPTTFFSVLREKGKNMERALAYLVREGELAASIWEDEWIDVAYPWDILRANEIIMNSWRSAHIAGSVRFMGDVRIEGPVYIEDDVEIRSGTIVIGPSYIGAGSFIGNNVLIRKYTSIGPESAIGYGVELKNCILFGKTKIGRLSFIGDSVMGHNVDIGSGTMTVNRELDGETIKTRVNEKLTDTRLSKLGAFVGDDVNIGASNTILAGTIIKSGANIPHHHSYP